MPRDLTTGEVAQRLGVAPRTVAKWTDSGLLPGYQLPGSLHRRIRAVDLLDFAREYEIPLELLSTECGAASE
jgi:excisionase family DNA binding protein